MARDLLLLMIVASLAITAKGDGKFFVREQVPAGIPYQRAILLFNGGQETLILQSKYDLPQSAAADSLGWIVPVPAVPELATMDVDQAADLFRSLSFQTRPQVIQISVGVWFAAMAIAVIAGVLLLRLLRDARLHPDVAYRAKRTRQIRVALFAGATIALLGAILSPHLGLSDVEVVKAERVGIYDAKVIRGQSAEALTAWLEENGFNFNDDDRQAFQDYVDRGWCFVTAQVRPNPGTDGGKIAFEGMVAPLILKFDTDRPIYPLALTATAGTETEVLIYTYSPARLACGGRLTLRYADREALQGVLVLQLADGKTNKWPLPEYFTIKPKALCKFKGRLTPAQMRQDLRFTSTSDNPPYRERRIVW